MGSRQDKVLLFLKFVHLATVSPEIFAWLFREFSFPKLFTCNSEFLNLRASISAVYKAYINSLLSRTFSFRKVTNSQILAKIKTSTREYSRIYSI